MLVAASRTEADVTWLGTEGPPVVFSAGLVEPAKPGDTLRVVVGAAIREITQPAVRFQIKVPSQFEIVSGDTAVEFAAGQTEGNWTILLLPSSPGSFELAGAMQVESRERRDEVELLLPIHVSADRVWSDGCQHTRSDTFRGGVRYRYGDTWLVPLEADEPPVTERDITDGGARARVALHEDARCSGCSQGDQPDTVNFMIIVDRDGKIRESRRMGWRGKAPSNAAIDAARQTLTKWRFEPARAKGQAVSDWLYVRVPVRPR
jgi:hypothetical protein